LYLTSLRRLRLYCKVTDMRDNNAMLSMYLASASQAIEEYLGRELELKSRTEEFDTEESQELIYPQAFPVVSITNVWLDTTGLFDGTESIMPVGLYHPGTKSRGVRLRFNPGRTLRGLRVQYVGGLAADAVETTLTLTGVGASAFEAGQWVRGSKSQAVGYVVSNGVATALVLESVFGSFKVGDVLTAYVDDELKGNAVVNTGGTVSAVTTPSLAQAYPNLASACEVEVNYLYKNSVASALWNDSTSKDSTQKRAYEGSKGPMKYELQPETRLFLQGLERVLL
jgi:hypothetical protein